MNSPDFWILVSKLLQLTLRVAGFIFLVPIPYLRAAPVQMKIALSILLAFLLLPGHKAHSIVPAGAAMERVVVAIAGECLLGLALSLSAALMLGLAMEVFVVASRLVGLNAGFGYVSTVDPNTQADSGILDVMGGLLASLVIVTAGLDRPILLFLSRALETPHWPDVQSGTQVVGKILGESWASGARLALPVIVLLLVIDLLLALGSKFQAQLQLITLSFPMKILGGLGMLAVGLSLWPEFLTRVMHDALAALVRL